MGKKDREQEKARIVRWPGILEVDVPFFRPMVAVILLVAGSALTFTQLGFVGIDLPDETRAYVVTLLPVVALGALLLGTGMGVLLGLVIGSVLLLHAWLLPLDHYELTFVTPLTSIVSFGITGFLFGVLFAFALRKKPRGAKRVIRIVMVALFVCVLYSLGFAINVVISLTVDAVGDLGPDASQAYIDARMNQLTREATDSARQMGSISLQALFTALLTMMACLLADHVNRENQQRQGSLGLRSIFGAWLSVVVLLAFMVMSAVSFGVITENERQRAEDGMRSEVNYLCKQLSVSNDRVKFFAEYSKLNDADIEQMDQGLVERLALSFSDDVLLDGYTLAEDGLIIITYGDSLYLSDDERLLKEGFCFEDYRHVFGTSFADLVERSVRDNKMQRLVYDESTVRAAGTEEEERTLAETSDPSIAYLYANRINLEDGQNGEKGSAHTIIVLKSSSQIFAARPSIMFWTTLSEFVLMAAVFAIVFLLLNRLVARRIDEENAALARITAGDLDARTEASGTREFDSLSQGINTTVNTLKGWIAEAESRMDAELATAKAIQEAALPRVFPPYPDILHFDVYATMEAAKQVGGDFYDFFLIGDADADEGRLGFVIADVSGKGVPAALFMMKAMTQIRDYMESGMELGEAMENANRQLCDGNEAGMFVTAWVGVLDYGTGHVDFVNAGHNPPLLWVRNQGEGKQGGRKRPGEGGWRWLTEKSGLPLGLFDSLPYKAYSLDCQIGDQFLLYTDGVTEAMDTEGQLYGEERLEELAQAHFDEHPRRLTEFVRNGVALHAQGAEQSDDITILILEVGVPPEITKTLVVNADVDELPKVNAFVHDELDRRLCPKRAQSQIDIAIEELFVNVARYAYPDATPENPGIVRIGCTYSSDPPSVRVDIVDEGLPYNPLEKPDAVTPDDIADVPIGGLGILMAKRSVDEMSYERDGASNVVSIVKRW